MKTPRTLAPHPLRLGLALCALAYGMQAGAVTLSNVPLYLGTNTPPNVLFILSNAQNMDENGNPSSGVPIGAAIGGSSQDSKSEIARAAIRQMEQGYLGQINMGLMTFKQYTPSSYYMYNSLYDASYNPANYAPPPPFVAKNATTKNYRIVNPVDTGNYIYYNWASPFYDTSVYPANFCYSNTAKFDNTTNIPAGTDKYRCFYTKTGTSDGIVSPLPSSGSATAAEQAYGYSGGLLYQGGFYPTDTDYATNTLDFGALVPSLYVSTAWFNNGSPGPGYLQVPIASLNSTQQTKINNKLTCNVPAAPNGAPSPNPTPASGPCNASSSSTGSSVLNSGLTAIEGTLNSAKNYFALTLPTSQGAPSSSYTLPQSCGKNFTVLLTNGLPSVTATGSVPKLSNGQVDVCSLTNQAVTAAQNLKNSGVNLYVVGYAMLPQVLQNYTNTCGIATNPLDQLASAGGTGNSYLASNPTQLQSALNSVFTSILQASGSSAALTSNSTSINANSYIYAASFNTVDWTGHLQAVPVTASGPGTAAWDAATLIPAWAGRNLLTWNGSAGKTLQWANLSAAEQCQLAGQAAGCTLTAAQITGAQQVLNYVSGDQSQEQKNGGALRNRSVVLGDIVDSNPLYLSTEDYGYGSLPGAEGSSYATYVAGKANNLPMIYVGANDGMLHGISASATASPGAEQFAYVPGALYAKLPALAQPSYNANHQYFVDGSPGSGDAYYGSAWHTLLIGTLGAGGTSVFALDITHPGAMSPSSVLWEFSDANDFGYTWGPGTVARFNDGNYYAVVNNGYNSANKHAVLFLIQVNNPANVIKLDAGSGGSGCTDDGLSAPAALDADGNRTVDAIYAGDLCGNVWKFDVSNAQSNKWAVAYKSGTTPLPIFTAKDGSGNRQPITAPLTLGTVPSIASGTVMVFFGTGEYLNPADTNNLATQSLYGILDSSTFSSGNFSGGQGALTRGDLQQQSIIFQGLLNASSTVQSRAVTTNTVSYPTSGSEYGWYMDLLTPPSTQTGERVISAPLLRGGRILFATMTPSSGTCVSGGTGWLMELDATTGGAPGYTFIDFNGDGQYDSSDNINLGNGQTAVAVGAQTSNGFSNTPVSLANGSSYSTFTNASSGPGGTPNCSGASCQTYTTKNPGGSPRASWTQIQ